MKINLVKWWTLAKGAASAWIDDYAPSMGAALSYYTVFSLAPMLLIVIGVAGLVFGEKAATGALFDQLNGLMGKDAANAVQGLLSSASKPAQGVLSTVIGVVVLIIGATSVFGELQDALDRIWRVPAKDKPSGLWGLLRSRLLSFGMILGIAFLLMVSLVVSAGVAVLGKWWGGAFGEWEIVAQALTFLFGFVVTTGGFAMIYKLMPRAAVQWRDVWIGALVTSFLFSLGRFLISLYVGETGIASSFGAAGSLILVFVWVYYSAQIFFLGAEFTWVYAKSLGSQSVARQSAAAPQPAPLTNRFVKPAPFESGAPTPITGKGLVSRDPDPGVSLGLASVAGGIVIGVVLRSFVRRALTRFV